jgi:hypothetical protein
VNESLAVYGKVGKISWNGKPPGSLPDNYFDMTRLEPKYVEAIGDFPDTPVLCYARRCLEEDQAPKSY